MFTFVGPITYIYQDHGEKNNFSHGFNSVALNTSGILYKGYKFGAVNVSTSL